MSKLDSAGNSVWASGMGGTGSDVGYGVAVDGSGNVHTTGSFQGTADFDPSAGGTQNLISTSGSNDVFVSRLDADGNYLWAAQHGGTNADYGYGIAVANTGGIHTTGQFAGVADFDPSGGVANITSTSGSFDIFVSRLNPPNVAPTISSNGGGATASTSVYENTTAVTTVTAHDYDPGTTFTYSLVGGADAAKFVINGSTGLLSLVTPADFESLPTDADLNGVYEVTVQVSDGAGGTDTQAISVTVTDQPHTLTAVYVDDDWVALGYGAAIADADPSVPGNQPATYGVNAFSLVEWGIDSVAVNGTVVLNAGTHPQNANLSTPFTLKVTGTTTVSGVLSGPHGLAKAGTGNLTLTGANTYLGTTAVTRGQLRVAADAALGAATAAVSVNTPGVLLVTASTTSSRIFDLSLGTLQVDAGFTLTLNAAEVNGGFLYGPGTIATTAGATTAFTGGTFAPSLKLSALGADAFTNVTTYGAVTLAAGQTAALTNVVNGAGGRLVVYGTALAADLVTYGYVEVSKFTGAAAAGWLRNAGTTPVVVAGGGSLNVGYAIPPSLGSGAPVGGTGGDQATREGRGRVDLRVTAGVTGGLQVLSGGVVRNNGFLSASAPAPRFRLERGSILLYGTAPGDSPASGFNNIFLTLAGGSTVADF